jgi:predicted GH43/DUF377 family glycosyl hydrolase
MKVIKSQIRLLASSHAVIAQFLHLPGGNRVADIIGRVNDLSESAVNEMVESMRTEFSGRHRDIEKIWMRHFEIIASDHSRINQWAFNRKLLIGGLFTKEYSIQAAALFNPSIVVHPDQSGLSKGQLRFLMSLRATGEGHISSIVFRSGILDKHGDVILEKASGYHTCLLKNENKLWHKSEIQKRISGLTPTDINSFDILPDQFTAKLAMELISSLVKTNPSLKSTENKLTDFFDANYDLVDSSKVPLAEKVIFPFSKAESMGMEDVRLVQFGSNGESCFYGTYTAYDGKQIRTQLIKTTDFNQFSISTITGSAIQDKGMAIFPEKINGQYAMISRQGGEKIHLMYSDDLYSWQNYQVLLEPQFSWELVQMGNCGSPVKTPEGWLLLIHGVGTMRTYVISAILLDLKDPSKVLRRLQTPLLKADIDEREGYVPNVVYTCGLIQHEKKLLIPYAMSDAATGFVTVDLVDLLNEMK